MVDTQGLSARELFRRTLDLFTEKEGRWEISFCSPVQVEIMDYTYPQGTKIGHMQYESAQVVYCAGKAWAVSVGTCPVDDPAALCSCDMVVILLPPNRKKDQRCRDVVEGIAAGDWFCNSFIQATDDGRLAVGKDGKFSEEITHLLKPKIGNFVLASKPAFVYKTEFAVVLHDAILTVLNTTGKW